MATWDTIDRYVVISTDTHAGADIGDYKPYLPARWHDEFDAWAKTYVSPFDDLIIATALYSGVDSFQNDRGIVERSTDFRCVTASKSPVSATTVVIARSWSSVGTKAFSFRS